MPAAAVIPAPIVYVNVVVLKKLVVGSRSACPGVLLAQLGSLAEVFGSGAGVLFIECPGLSRPRFTLKKLECSQQASFA